LLFFITFAGDFSHVVAADDNVPSHRLTFLQLIPQFDDPTIVACHFLVVLGHLTCNIYTQVNSHHMISYVGIWPTCHDHLVGVKLLQQPDWGP
jgi:hypothetical protein